MKKAFLWDTDKQEATPIVYAQIASAAASPDSDYSIPAARLFLALNHDWTEKTVIERTSVVITMDASDTLSQALSAAMQLRDDAIDIESSIIDA